MIIIAAGLAALAILVLIPPPPRSRLRALASRNADAIFPANVDSGRRLLTTAVAVGAVGIALAVGGTIGILVGIASAGVGLSLLRHAAPKDADDELTAHALPQLTDLLAATVAAGAALPAAIDAAAGAVDGSSGAALRRASAALALGATTQEAWRRAGPAFAPVGAAFTRSAHSGAALATVLASLAEDMRRDRRTAVDVAARAAGVKAVAPLVVCFLPAFVLVGVVPIVVSFAAELIG